MDFGAGDAIPLHNRVVNSVKSVAGASFYKAKQAVDNLRPDYDQNPRLHGPQSFNDLRHMGKRALDNKVREGIANQTGVTANLADTGYRNRVAVYKQTQKEHPNLVSGKLQKPPQGLTYVPPSTTAGAATRPPSLLSRIRAPPLPFRA